MRLEHAVLAAPVTVVSKTLGRAHVAAMLARAQGDGHPGAAALAALGLASRKSSDGKPRGGLWLRVQLKRTCTKLTYTELGYQIASPPLVNGTIFDTLQGAATAWGLQSPIVIVRGVYVCLHFIDTPQAAKNSVSLR